MVSATFNSKSKEIDRQVSDALDNTHLRGISDLTFPSSSLQMIIDAARRLFVNITAKAVFLFDSFEKKILSLPPSLKLDNTRKVIRRNPTLILTLTPTRRCGA